MVARLERTKDGFAVLLTAEMVEALHLTEGSPVEVLPVIASEEETRTQVRCATAEEVMRAYQDTLPRHEAAYRELAK